MANDEGYTGRKVILEWNNIRISGVREKSVKLDGAPVDVSSDENNGWQTLLDEAGENKVEIGISGVIKSDVLRDAWHIGDRTKLVTLTYPNGAELSGMFYLGAYSEKGAYKDAVTFEATLSSTGAIAWTEYA